MMGKRYKKRMTNILVILLLFGWFKYSYANYDEEVVFNNYRVEVQFIIKFTIEESIFYKEVFCELSEEEQRKILCPEWWQGADGKQYQIDFSYKIGESYIKFMTGIDLANNIYYYGEDVKQFGDGMKTFYDNSSKYLDEVREYVRKLTIKVYKNYKCYMEEKKYCRKKCKCNNNK